MKICPICNRQYIKWNEDTCRPCLYKAHPELGEERALVLWKRKMLIWLKKKLYSDVQREIKKQWARDHPRLSPKKFNDMRKHTG